jgi:hypothetical protein
MVVLLYLSLLLEGFSSVILFPPFYSLSALLKFEELSGNLQGMRFGVHGPYVSHVLFADDSLIFARALRLDVEAIKQVFADL